MLILLVGSCVICLLALGLTCLNVLTWPRGKKGTASSLHARVSILIPARNEIATIESAVRAALANDPFEVVVYDDKSTDGTSEILASLCQEFDTLRVLNGVPLPSGWVGKPHACHHLGQAAMGDVLFFVDADTLLKSDGLAHVNRLFESYDASVVTAVPQQKMVTWFERWILPLLHLTYTSWFPIFLTWRSKNIRFLAANGQLLAIQREAYEAVGGFEAVRHEVVDDMAMCRLVKQSDRRVVFADGFEIATCRMYQGTKEVWEGFSKNIYQGLGASVLGLLVVLALYLTGFVLPYVALPLAWAFQMKEATWLAGGAIGLSVLLRLVLALRFKHPLVTSLVLHPFAVCGLMAIAINSAIWHWRGAIKWSGRTYGAKLESTSEEVGEGSSSEVYHGSS